MNRVQTIWITSIFALVAQAVLFGGVAGANDFQVKAWLNEKVDIVFTVSGLPYNVVGGQNKLLTPAIAELLDELGNVVKTHKLFYDRFNFSPPKPNTNYRVRVTSNGVTQISEAVASPSISNISAVSIQNNCTSIVVDYCFLLQWTTSHNQYSSYVYFFAEQGRNRRLFISRSNINFFNFEQVQVLSTGRQERILPDTVVVVSATAKLSDKQVRAIAYGTFSHPGASMAKISW
jgi:hypothetical protein